MSDYTYCLNDGDCIHRRGCRRWYRNHLVANQIKADNTEFVDEKKCLPDHTNQHCENSYDLLDRFRYSTGKEFI